MKRFQTSLFWVTSLAMVWGTLGLGGCKSSKTPATQNGGQQSPQGQAAQMQLPEVTLTADGLDELLAPIALYPDPVLAVMLQASQNPQEVMDGGNWLLLDQNKNLKDAALDEASSKAGFTPVMQALLHFGPVVDLMCTQFDWTKQLGASYREDPKAVLASVQRLRAQAVDNGALKTGPQMTVDVKKEQGQQVVEIAPTDPKVVYVPQYNPSQVYGTTTTTTSGAPASSQVVEQEKSGVSTGSAVMIGLLSFGAGMALGSAIHHDDYYYPAWGYGGVYYGGRPYYPPPYRPAYGGGWGGAYGYNRPVGYANNVYVNRSNNAYYNRFDGNKNLRSGYQPQTIRYNNRPGSVSANSMGNRSGVNRGVTTARAGSENNNFRGQQTYQGAKRAEGQQQGKLTSGSQAPREGAQRAAGGNAGKSAYQGSSPKTVAANRGAATTTYASNRGDADRGYGGRQPATDRAPSTSRAASQPETRASKDAGGAFGGGRESGSAFSGAKNAKADRAASDRGRQSMGASRGSSGGQRAGGRRK